MARVDVLSIRIKTFADAKSPDSCGRGLNDVENRARQKP